MNDEPIARGIIVRLSEAYDEELRVLGKEAMAMLRALKAEARIASDADEPADFVLVLAEPRAQVDTFPLGSMADRVGAAIAVAEDEREGRVINAAARKRLRAAGAVLGPRELVFSPSDFGYLGLESDTLRERLEILLHTLVLDAERLRLKREGWEEPV